MIGKLCKSAKHFQKNATFVADTLEVDSFWFEGKDQNNRGSG